MSGPLRVYNQVAEQLRSARESSVADILPKAYVYSVRKGLGNLRSATNTFRDPGENTVDTGMESVGSYGQNTSNGASLRRKHYSTQ
jgi:hypothetical protein